MALDEIVEEGMAEAKVRPVKLERIVVGVDFGEASIAAATWAARSFAPGAQIVLVHSIHVPEPPAFLAGLYPQTDRVIETAQTGAQQRLRDLGTSIATGLVWTEVRIGKPEVVLAAVAAEYGADLIVIGRRTVRPGIRDRLGSTPERVLRQSPIPLLLAAPQHEGAPRHLLAAIDGSVATESALGWTDHLVARYGATATLVHVVAPLAHLSEDTALAAPLVTDGTTAAERAATEQATRWLEAQRRTMSSAARVDVAVRVGRAATQIVAEAKGGGLDLIVLGAHGRGAIGRLVFGSVAEAVLREAPCSVLVVREGQGAAPAEASAGATAA